MKSLDWFLLQHNSPAFSVGILVLLKLAVATSALINVSIVAKSQISLVIMRSVVKEISCGVDIKKWLLP